MEREQTVRRERMLTFKSGGWVILLSVLLTLAATVWNLWPMLATKFRPAVGDGVHVDSYGFDLRKCEIPREKLVAAGVAKDQIPALAPEGVEMISPAEVTRIREQTHLKLVVDADRVIGLDIGGEARAYPLRVLVQHEVCNDVVGGVPVAVTYMPLCDSVAVFDRRMGDKTLVFGMSGLMYNSNPLIYNREKTAGEESLWCQLLSKAVAGPAVGTELKRIEHVVTEWGSWRTKYPQTKVLAGEARFRTTGSMAISYAKDPYQSYASSNELKFPVSPLWAGDKKVRIVALPEGEGKWRVVKAGEAGERRDGVEAFVFAWYAMWPGSDFSAVK